MAEKIAPIFKLFQAPMKDLINAMEPPLSGAANVSQRRKSDS